MPPKTHPPTILKNPTTTLPPPPGPHSLTPQARKRTQMDQIFSPTSRPSKNHCQFSGPGSAHSTHRTQTHPPHPIPIPSPSIKPPHRGVGQRLNECMTGWLLESSPLQSSPYLHIHGINRWVVMKKRHISSIIKLLSISISQITLYGTSNILLKHPHHYYTIYLAFLTNAMNVSRFLERKGRCW